eukprot:TRINITY_DN3782_c0_g4_i6.p1 TRINITY_DN3782_c0_g4~~TRINITY_DN3782_c0_g4_i6.p1  ORF type:complete len:744 (+),score=180.37 TRINITY_DN3782_c0_g4_i6:35-2233(+)
MIRRPPRSTHCISSAASDVYKRQIMYVPMFICEYMFYRFKTLSIMRGAFITCFIYFTIFYGTSVRYYNPGKYPLISPIALLWEAFMLFVHIFYVRGWIITLITHSVVYIEILVITFLRHGRGFVLNSTFYGVASIFYYFVLFTSYIGISVYSFRTFERKGRASFFYESKARKEVGKWRALLNDLPEPVILVQDGVITFCNTATQRFFNLQPENSEVRTNSNVQLIQEFDKVVSSKFACNSINNFIKNPQVVPESEGFTYRNAAGKRHKLQIKHVMIESIRGPPIIEFIFHDVTTVEELEREKTQRYCSSVLVSTASHEIRTPINAIKVVLGTLESMATNEKQQEEIRIAHASMKRLELYVKELAILQQIETGNLKLEQELFNPNDVISKTMDYFLYAAKTKGLTFKFYENDITSVCSDKEKYEIIVYHILENALKYTHEGGISIRINYSPEENSLITSIIDTGNATYNNQDFGFKLFSPSDDFDLTCPKDINLGLFLADTLAAVLGDGLKLESLLGIGTRALFTIKCNFEEVNEEDVQEENPVPKSLTTLRKHTWKSLKGLMSNMELTKPDTEDYIINSPIKMTKESCNCPKILIVDDESFNVFVLKKYLVESGLQADVAMNGKIAIETMLKRKEKCKVCRGYRLVFMDINMPVMNGIVAMSKIKDLVNVHVIPDVSVVAVTAAVQLNEPGVAERYRSYGFKRICKGCVKSVVQKPVDKSTFMSTLEYYLYL